MLLHNVLQVAARPPNCMHSPLHGVNAYDERHTTAYSSAAGATYRVHAIIFSTQDNWQK